uniref:Putative terminase n=1 Tax=viral metagenome TaxID=1070528 RepID=A0A6M3J728_9ZZZZ
MVWTQDEHDKITPFKRFPDKEHTRLIADLWYRTPLLLLPKSRQMLMTWLISACYLWDTQFHQGRLNFFQSKKEDDADRIVQRAWFIYEHQPDWIKDIFPAEYTSCHLKFKQSKSEIWGVPQGGDQIRSHTASGILSDEMGFQPEAEDAYTGALPTIKGGGRFTGVSSANPGFFFYLVGNRLGN